MENSSKIEGPFFKGEPRAGRDAAFRLQGQQHQSRPQSSVRLARRAAGTLARTSRCSIRTGKTSGNPATWTATATWPISIRSTCAAGKIKRDSQLVQPPVKISHDQCQRHRSRNVSAGESRRGPDPVHPARRLPPITVLNHPPFIRMEQRSIPPLGSRTASITVSRVACSNNRANTASPSACAAAPNRSIS